MLPRYLNDEVIVLLDNVVDACFFGQNGSRHILRYWAWFVDLDDLVRWQYPLANGILSIYLWKLLSRAHAF